METVKRFRLVMTKNGSCLPMFTGEQFVLDGALFQEHPEGELTRATDVDRLQQSERYAWKNTREIDAERMKFRKALEELHAKLGGQRELMRSELIEFIDLALGPESPVSASGDFNG